MLNPHSPEGENDDAQKQAPHGHMRDYERRVEVVEGRTGVLAGQAPGALIA
jgi:hypothetical protein